MKRLSQRSEIATPRPPASAMLKALRAGNGVRNDDICICYLIDVAPDKFRGGGQGHLMNLIHEMNFQSASWLTNFKFQIFAATEASKIFRLLWMIWVIPQIIFIHLFINRFNLIHSHSIPGIVAGKVISGILKIPIIVTVHGFNEKSWMEKFILTKIEYDAQITVSRNFLKYPNINKSVIYIPNGVDMNKYVCGRQTPKGPTFQVAIPCKGRILSGEIVLFVGRKSDPVKGFKILEKAMEIVKREIPNVKLLVMDGSYPQNEVVKAYHQADLFVLPSLSEGFPLTLLEAWAAKLPVVASAVGEIPYLMEGHPSMAECLVKPGDTKDLADKIISVLKSGNLVGLGESGYLLAKRYDWKIVAERTSKVYNRVLHGNI